MKQLRIEITFAALFLACAAGGVNAQTPNHTYPRTAIFHFGKAVPDWYARFDLVDTPNENASRAAAIKNLNPGAVVLPTRGWTTWDSGNKGRFPPETKANWLVPTSTGAIAGAAWNSLLIDLTNYCPKVNGKRYNDRFPEFFAGAVDLSVFDGLASDWLWSKPHNIKDVDFDRNGVNDFDEHGKKWVESVWQDGVQTLLQNFRKIMPANKLLLVNSGLFQEWGWNETNGPILEHWSGIQNWGYFWRVYRDFMNGARQPHILIMDGEVDGGDPFRPNEPKNYFKLMRFLLTATMLGDGYFSFTDTKSEHHFNRYYDEFDLNLGYPKTAGLVLPNGCYARFFDKGVSITNPTGQPQTVTDADLRSLAGYAGPYNRFLGGQDPSVNNGQSFDRVDLWGAIDPRSGKKVLGDGIILVKQPITVISDIIIDNLDYGTSPSSDAARFSGSWNQTDQGDLGWYIIDRARSGWYPHAYAQAGNGNAVATYTPGIGVAGKYEVFEWHGYVNQSGMASNVPCKIVSAGGQVTNKTIDQTRNQGQWNSLGIYNFAAGKQGKIILNNNANGIVVADAFRVVYRDGGVPPDPTVDTTPPQPPSGIKAIGSN